MVTPAQRKQEITSCNLFILALFQKRFKETLITSQELKHLFYFLRVVAKKNLNWNKIIQVIHCFIVYCVSYKCIIWLCILCTFLGENTGTNKYNLKMFTCVNLNMKLVKKIIKFRLTCKFTLDSDTSSEFCFDIKWYQWLQYKYASLVEVTFFITT